MALQAWMSITGTKQGPFKGETTDATRKNKWMPVLGFSCNVTSPHDPITGMSSGKRSWTPITVIKQWGAASPQILTALTTNESLATVEFEFERTNADGTTVVYQSITLVNASLAAVNQSTANASSPQPANSEVNLSELEQLQFVFQMIEVSNQDGPTSFSDNWV